MHDTERPKPNFHHEAHVGDTFELQTAMTRNGTPNLLSATTKT